MKLFDGLRRLLPKKKDDISNYTRENREPMLPSDLERFKIRREPIQEMQPSSPYETQEQMPPRPKLPEVGPMSEPKPIGNLDKDDMILQKLETIDARLRLIEEKIK